MTGVITTHYHVVVNVSGYLPMADDMPTYETFGQAAEALRSELGEEIDQEESDERVRELESAQRELDATLAAGADWPHSGFLAYTSTHADSDHDIPTAWQVVTCEEAECEVPE